MSYHAKALFREEHNIKGFCKDYGIGRGNTFFLTITFKSNVIDKGEAVKYWNKLRTQLTKVYKLFRYICVYERQNRGAWHMHILCNCPFVSMKGFKLVLREKLKNSNTEIGYCQAKWTYGTADSIGNYMFKYLTKSDREPYIRYVNYSRNFLRCCGSVFMFVHGGAGRWRAACRVLDEMFPVVFKHFYYHSSFDDKFAVINGCQGDLRSFLNSLEILKFYFDRRVRLYDYYFRYSEIYWDIIHSIVNTYKRIYPVGQLTFNLKG